MALIEPDMLKDFKPYIYGFSFIMALRSDFKGLHRSILNHTPLTTVDSVVHELIAEETHIKSHADKGPKTATPIVFVVPQ